MGQGPKYGNKKVVVQGIKFDSKWESQRYLYLKSLERAGTIKDLELQVRFNLEVNGQKICAYVADFCYNREDKDGVWHYVVDDAKGVETPEFKAKEEVDERLVWVLRYSCQKKGGRGALAPQSYLHLAMCAFNFLAILSKYLPPLKISASSTGQ